MRRNGFVLLEAVVALAILGVASIVLLQVRSQQIRVAVQARELLTAQALAEDRLSAVRLLDYELLADPPDSLMEGVFPEPFQDFEWATEISLIDDEYDLFGVEVVVLGPVERFPLRTLMHRPRMVLAGGAVGGGTQGGVGDRSGMMGERGGQRGGMGEQRGGTGDQRGGQGGRGGQTGGPGGARGGTGGTGGTRGTGGGPGGTSGGPGGGGS